MTNNGNQPGAAEMQTVLVLREIVQELRGLLETLRRVSDTLVRIETSRRR